MGHLIAFPRQRFPNKHAHPKISCVGQALPDNSEPKGVRQSLTYKNDVSIATNPSPESEEYRTANPVCKALKPVGWTILSVRATLEGGQDCPACVPGQTSHILKQ
jgi:hypothetical protein